MSDAEVFSAEDPYAPKRSKAGCGLVALIVGLAGGAVVLAVACCGGFAIFGMNVVAEQVAEDLRDNPVIEERLGAITSIETAWAASAAAGEDEFVFDVSGPKGRGRLRVVTLTVDEDTEDVVSGTLVMDDGERYDLFPDESGGAAETDAGEANVPPDAAG